MPIIEAAELTDDALAALSDSFQDSSSSEIIAWAVQRFGSALALSASMTDAVLIDLATRVDAQIEVVFIDTGYHFPETLQTLQVVRRRYALNLRIMTIPVQTPPMWTDQPTCCSKVKVAMLDRALADKQAWMSGIRRSDASTRASAPILARDSRGLIKVNPLANWSDADIAAYVAKNDVPVNPLTLQGYPSIGCMPCTTPVADGEDARAGRWRDTDKTECGINVSLRPT